MWLVGSGPRHPAPAQQDSCPGPNPGISNSARLATLPYGLDSNVTKLLANLLTKPSVFYYFANCFL